MTNPDQDVTLDDMARAVVKWMDGWELVTKKDPMADPSSWKVIEIQNRHDGIHLSEHLVRHELPPTAIYTSLDVIREVEEALSPKLMTNYLDERYEIARGQVDEHREWSNIPGVNTKMARWMQVDQQDPETRLRAIYRTLRESGEI